MISFNEEIDIIKTKIISKYSPVKIILFGSYAKGWNREDSDIDLCIVCEYEDKKNLLMDMLINIDSERDVDFILYRPDEWEKHTYDSGTFASLIKREGVILYG